MLTPYSASISSAEPSMPWVHARTSTQSDWLQVKTNFGLSPTCLIQACWRLVPSHCSTVTSTSSSAPWMPYYAMHAELQMLAIYSYIAS